MSTCIYLRLSLLLAYVLASSGCSTLHPHGGRYQEVSGEIRDYIVAYPQGLKSSQSLQDLLELKRSQGFAVQTLIISGNELSPIEQAAKFQSQLQELESELGQLAYLLIVGGHSDLITGAWDVPELEGLEGAGRSIHSDLPYFADTKLDWNTPMTIDTFIAGANSRFVAGRFPFSDEPTLAQAVNSTVAAWERLRRDGTSAPEAESFALLGGERFAIKHDTSVVMKRAQTALRRRGWKTELWAADKPHDVDLATSGHPWLSRWAETSPNLVYTIAHGDAYELGETLISPGQIDAALTGKPARPQQPAVFLSMGCQMGDPLAITYPGNRSIVRELFKHGYVAAVACSLEQTAPSPLATGVGAEINIARAVGDGLPIGLAIRATKARYMDQAPKMPGFWLSEESRQRYLLNIAGIGLYGDPSLPVRH